MNYIHPELNPAMLSFTSFSDADADADKFTLYVSQGMILNIKYSDPQELTEGEVVIYNMLGQVITRKKLESSPLNQVSLPNHSTCYIVRISYAGKVFTQKIIASN